MPNFHLDKELVDKIKGLHLQYGSEPQPDLLISIPNNDIDSNFEVRISTNEFTSLCPLNMAQPDYATLHINYRPNSRLAELKSLKLYFCSYRLVPIFHEMVPNLILKHLVSLLSPKWMEVIGGFSVRGGLDATVIARYLEDDEVGTDE
jgi:7-cyano-7-deazaguanine reductase